MCIPLQSQTIIIETPKGSFVKRDEAGSIDFVSPCPCPFNYGHIKGMQGGDGDPLDGILLGASREEGSEIIATVVGCVRFIDDNLQDDKWILSEKRPSWRQKAIIVSFFGIYVQAKKCAAWIKRRKGRVYVERIEYF